MSALHQPLAKNLRTQLENTVKAARDVAEIAARATLTNLGVGDRESHAHLSDEQKALRRRLRAHGRQLGDIKHPDDSQEIRHLSGRSPTSNGIACCLLGSLQKITC